MPHPLYDATAKRGEHVWEIETILQPKIIHTQICDFVLNVLKHYMSDA